MNAIAIETFGGSIHGAIDGAASTAASVGAQLVVGRAIAGNFIKNASKTQLKTFANSLGYVGRSYKNTSCWTGKIMFDASASNMEKPLAIATAYIISVFVDISMAMKK